MRGDALGRFHAAAVALAHALDFDAEVTLAVCERPARGEDVAEGDVLLDPGQAYRPAAFVGDFDRRPVDNAVVGDVVVGVAVPERVPVAAVGGEPFLVHQRLPVTRRVAAPSIANLASSQSLTVCAAGHAGLLYMAGAEALYACPSLCHKNNSTRNRASSLLT